MNRTATPMLAAAIAPALAIAAGATAQVVLNEAFVNPPNGGDDSWEYIELYGPAGFDLTGFAVVLVSGGRDTNGDDIPDFFTFASEVDEAYSLDGWSIGPDGFFVLYNRSGGNAGVGQFNPIAPESTPLTENDSVSIFDPESLDNKFFVDGASFGTLHIPSIDTPGNLENALSTTILLVRRRPGHALNTDGTSSFAADYAWKKDAPIDVDYNGRLDFGDETPVTNGTGTGSLAALAPFPVEPAQIIDEIAWSNQGGKEYNTAGRGLASAEFSTTPGFNPDVISRVRYIPGTPEESGLGFGSTITGSGELRGRRAADESWIYGNARDYTDSDPFNNDSLAPGAPGYTEYYDRLVERGDDGIVGTTDDELNYLAPTDPLGFTYSYDGPGDADPLLAPFFMDSPALDPMGTLLFEPYDIARFEFTPGAFNDAPPAATGLIGTDIETQFRFVRGDFDFDGDVDCDDRALIEAAQLAGATLDDETDLVRDFNTDDESDDELYTGFDHQLAEFNAVLAMIRMDLDDGSTGEWTDGQVFDGGLIVAWGGAVTADDLAAFDAEFALTCGCDPDLTGDGELAADDQQALLTLVAQGDLAGDYDADGAVTFLDVLAYLADFDLGCE